MKFIIILILKIFLSVVLGVWIFKLFEREGLFRYMEIVGLFFK